MLKNLTIQKRFTIMAAVPMIIIAALGATRVFVPYGIFALVGLFLTGIVAVVLSQSIGKTLSETAESARQLAHAQEAVLVGDEAPLNELAPLPTPTGELGDLHSALNSVQDGSRKVIASQRGAVKEGLATIVVDLARRNQTLLDRQIEFIETLENGEEDPDKLEQLFTVDHLATRMRRNAESLLVLAQAEPGKRRGGPVDATDVIRVAIGEIESYTHINLGTVAPGRLSPTNAIDLAHLLAELMENATQFSPPETPVDVYSDQLEDAYVVSVADFGVGMSEEQMAEANRTLEDPPELGLAMTRSLGFVVVGRLAERLGASVQLYPSAKTGVTAEIVLPNSILLPPSDGSDSADGGKVQFNNGGASAKPKARRTGQSDPNNTDSGSGATDSESSPALARLLGVGTQGLPETEKASELSPATGNWADSSPFPSKEESDTSALPARGKKAKKGASSKKEQNRKDDPNVEANKTKADLQPVSDGAIPQGWTPPPVTPDAPSMTSKLSEALPTGGALDAGMDSLLQAPDEVGAPAGGLAKRTRSESRAPKSEGRTVPDAGRPKATAKNRKPDEIRSMLLQYRAGLKGSKPTEEADASSSTTSTATTNEQDKPGALQRRTEQDPS